MAAIELIDCRTDVLVPTPVFLTTVPSPYENDNFNQASVSDRHGGRIPRSVSPILTSSVDFWLRTDVGNGHNQPTDVCARQGAG